MEISKTEPIEIKQELDLIDGWNYYSEITIERDPKEYILYKEYNKNQSQHYICDLKEENKQANDQNIEIKKEIDLIDSCKYENVNTSPRHIETKIEEKSYHFSPTKPFKNNLSIKSLRQKSDSVYNGTHNSQKQFKCDICQHSFTQFSNLKRHKMIHTGEKAYKCDICEKSFRQKSDMMIHTSAHTGKKPFKCNICTNSFALMSRLKQHMIIHTGDRPYKCPTCEKSFRQKKDLPVHIRTHTGEKLFTCDVCEMAFCKMMSLKNHKLTHLKTI
ncbi:Hypothetical protein CINCED_3A025514 [Cinara cedri]|uniref:C2H2-type domain-containing protein n=1 Tax=Cinara cedri TaxID=506608 RepID=A0A5E4N8D0_9HEMI|nr:Hypothetical protein CINCED_3A025514 [Cinara cedri]